MTLPSRAGGRVSPMGSWGSWGTPRPYKIVYKLTGRGTTKCSHKNVLEMFSQANGLPGAGRASLEAAPAEDTEAEAEAAERRKAREERTAASGRTLSDALH
eukprot:429342-Prorocentrum_minimum.AAC.1